MRKEKSSCIKPAVIFAACIHTIYASILFGGSTWLMMGLIFDMNDSSCETLADPMILIPIWIYAVILFSEGLRIQNRARKGTLDLFVVNEFLFIQTLLMCFFIIFWCTSELSINFKILGIVRFSFDFFYAILLCIHLHELHCDKHTESPKLLMTQEELTKSDGKVLQI